MKRTKIVLLAISDKKMKIVYKFNTVEKVV